MKILLDAGHGATDPGACGCGLREKDLTLEAVLYIGRRLEQLGAAVTYTRTGDTAPGDATARGKIAKGHDYLISVHFNAGGGRGSEVYCNCRERFGTTEQLYKKVLSPYFVWRGIKSRRYSSGNTVLRTPADAPPYPFSSLVEDQDWYGVLREGWHAGVSGDLLEIAFIDSPADMEIYKAHKEKIWEGIVQAICQAHGISYKASNPSAQDNPAPGPLSQEPVTMDIGPASAGDAAAILREAKRLSLPCKLCAEGVMRVGPASAGDQQAILKTAAALGLTAVIYKEDDNMHAAPDDGGTARPDKDAQIRQLTTQLNEATERAKAAKAETEQLKDAWIAAQAAYNRVVKEK